MKMINKAILFLCLGVLSGCTWMKGQPLHVQQGNVIQPQKVAQLRLGMMKGQVAYLMGYPVSDSLFEPDRWDYVYTYQVGEGPRTLKHLTLYFRNDALVRIQK